MALRNFWLTEPYGARNFKTLLIQFISDLAQTLYGRIQAVTFLGKLSSFKNVVAL